MRSLFVALLLLAVVLIASVGLQASQPPDASAPGEYRAAIDQAERTNKPLVVMLGAQWCQPCTKAEALYGTPLRQRGCYVHVDIDAHRDLARRLGMPAAVPAIIVYDRDGRGRWAAPRVIVGLPAIRVWVEAPAVPSPPPPRRG